MEHSHTEVQDQPVTSSPAGDVAPVSIASSIQPAATVSPQACATCGTTPAVNGGITSPSYIYAIGRIEARFPRPSVEKEFAQATGRADTSGLTDRQALQKVLSQRQNRYLARQLCWVMTIEGL